MFDLQKIKDRLLVKYPAFASAIANANYYAKPVKTLCTDGKDIYYDANFLNSLSFDEQLFVLAHEICHICLHHIERSKDKNPVLWNIATDAVINMLLIEDGLTAPSMVIVEPDAIHYSAEEYYKKLIKENSSETSDEKEQCDNPSNVDDHSIWKKALEERKNGSFEPDKSENDELDKIDEQDVFSVNERERIENLKKLKEELLKESIQAGTPTHSFEIPLGNIGLNKELIDWRVLLRKSVNIKLRWDTSNPEVDHGVLTPILRRVAYPRTEILLDTSGSIDDEMLKNFLRECKYILQNTEMWVGCFDTQFYGFKKINSEKDIDNMTFYGRGGTDFDVAVNAFTNRADNKIIFTDGYADMPKEKINAIWVVFGAEKIKPQGGQVIYINPNQLKQLRSLSGTKKR